jgi:hypothetical protein
MRQWFGGNRWLATSSGRALPAPIVSRFDAGLIFRKAGKWHGDILIMSWIIEGLNAAGFIVHSHLRTFLPLDRSRAEGQTGDR